jgi:mannose-1-phosphate guanylyltransferase
VGLCFVRGVTANRTPPIVNKVSAVLHIPTQAWAEPPALRNLRALVLLAGAVRQHRMDSMVGRPLFDLPLEPKRTILDHWRVQVQELAEMRGRGPLPMRIMMNRAASQLSDLPGGPAAQLERDPFDYRGAGGVLRDVAAEYQDEDYLLVANSSQVLMQPLAELAGAMAERAGDVVIVSHADGTPSGLSLVRCGAVRDVPATGFVDFKEQALPAIAKDHRVNVLELEHPSGLPVRTLSNYILALRRYHQQRTGQGERDDPLAEGWESAFAIVEEGAEVHSSAQLNDSVVLRGGRVEANAVLARSVVCPGGALRTGQVMVDNLVKKADNGPGRSS